MENNYVKLLAQSKYELTAMGDGATIAKMPLCNELWQAGGCPHTDFGIHDCSAHMATGGKKDAEYIASQFEFHCDKFDQDNAQGLINLFLFDGASNVQKAAQLLSTKYPITHCIHDIEHMFVLVLKTLPSFSL